MRKDTRIHIGLDLGSEDSDKFIFIAQDKSGHIFKYTHMPSFKSGLWFCDEGCYRYLSISGVKPIDNYYPVAFDLRICDVYIENGKLWGKSKKLNPFEPIFKAKVSNCTFTHISLDDPQPPEEIYSCKCKSEIYPYKYIAQDRNGDIFLHKNKPRQSDYEWFSNESNPSEYLHYLKGRENLNWKNTLNNLIDGKGYKIISGQLVERTSSVKARWEASGKAPIVQFANIHTDWEWTFYDLDTTPWWHEESVYRIHPESESWKKSDTHYDLRKKWLLSNKTLPIQVEGTLCKTGWADLNPSDNIKWSPVLLYREKPKSIKLVSRRYVAKGVSTGNLMVLVRNLRNFETEESAEKATQGYSKFVKWYDKEWHTYTYNPG